MKLLFLSNTRGNTNSLLINLLKSWLTKNTKVGYLPSTPDPTKKYFSEAVDWLKDIQSDIQVDYLDIHDGKRRESDQVKDYNYLFLSGGNTYHLINGLRQSGMDKLITEIATETENGIIGVSAGGIVLTPDLRSATAKNDIGVTDYNGLSLVNFGFYPHFDKEGKSQTREIKEFFGKNANVEKVYATTESSAMLHTNGVIQPLGDIFLFSRDRREIQLLK